MHEFVAFIREFVLELFHAVSACEYARRNRIKKKSMVLNST